ncbi:MAG: nucleoside deaminase [Pseudomonadota bacterium]
MKFSETDTAMMRMALSAAEDAAHRNEAPIGAVLVSSSGTVLSVKGNSSISMNDPTAHAEILALRSGADQLSNYRLTGASLYVTLEPCAMCAGAISHARISRLVIAAADPKGGAVWNGPRFFEQPTCHWRPEVLEGPFADEAGTLLRDFFKKRRKTRHKER